MLFIKNKVKIGVQAVKSESQWHKLSFVCVPFINKENVASTNKSAFEETVGLVTICEGI